jgi:hypothetical protein
MCFNLHFDVNIFGAFCLNLAPSNSRTGDFASNISGNPEFYRRTDFSMVVWWFARMQELMPRPANLNEYYFDIDIQ